MKTFVILLTALSTSQPTQEPAAPRDPPVRPKIEAVFFRDPAEEYFQRLRLLERLPPRS